MIRRILFTGSRKWHDVERVRRIVWSLPAGTVVIHGGHRDRRNPRISLDAIVDRLARERGLPVEVYEAEWTVHEPGWCRCTPAQKAERGWCEMAGPRRNQRMLDEAKPTECHAFTLPGCRGTLDMMARCKAAKIPGVEHRAAA